MAIAFALCASAAVQGASPDAVERFVAAVPTTVHSFSPDQADQLAALAKQADDWFADATNLPPAATNAQRLAVAERLVAAMSKLDGTRVRALDLRKQFAALPGDTNRQPRLVGYVATLNVIVDLLARANYTSLSALDEVGFELAADPPAFDKLCRTLTDAKNQIGAVALAPLLVERRERTAPQRYLLTPEQQLSLLRLISTATPAEALGDVADLVRAPDVPAFVSVVAAETIRRVGLPQDAMPDGDPTLPKPRITAGELHSILSRLDASSLDDKRAPLFKDLLAWLDLRRKRGIVGEEPLVLEGRAIRPGDWMLMRNPSPYNLFSDLAPGLFTHVGVVAATTPSDGIRRIVVVDLPERGTRLPATPVDTFVKRTLNYAFLRHEEPTVAARMASVASSIVGSPSQFDLNFRIDRVDRLRGKPLAGQTITTYCAGLLWLCAQETGRPRSEFFPIPEKSAGGRTSENLAKLGISIGDDFVSPTGPLFSPRMTVAAWRTPMYLPQREIEQAVFDHFARGLREQELSPSLDQYQSLRLKLAEAAKSNDLLAKALAKANDVSEEMNLVSAAKAAAVVETLDEAAYGASAAYGQAFDAIVVEDDDRPQLTPTQRQAISTARETHADLRQRWLDYRLSSRELRQALVRHYIAQGQRQLDARFFSNKDLGNGR
ncbi:MAG: hypothetical protein DCC68_14550 [Planctomycetota bacterium]|nr:MAG: hypothetical protein DCC68_14550 [Planctomycetota bacterium]